MDSPNMKAKIISGTQNVIAPVAGMLNTAWDPWPCCQNQVIAPNVAASETRFSTTALTGSRTERNAPVRSTRVSTAMTASMSGKFPNTACT
jgi:transposase